MVFYVLRTKNEKTKQNKKTTTKNKTRHVNATDCINMNFNMNAIIDQNSSVIRQKGESQNGCLKKAKHAKISEKPTFQGVRNVYFSELLACFAFLKHLF